MPPLRKGSLPAANKIFVNRDGPLKLFEDAAFAIPRDRARLIVFYGVGGQGKTALCREIWRRTGDDPSYRFLRRAELDLHGRPKTDPDILLVWIRNGFAKAGIVLPCFDLAFALAWDATRGEQPMPQMDSGWLARRKEDIGGTATELIQALKEALGEAAAGIPVLGTLGRAIGGWAVKAGYEGYLHRTRDALGELYRDGELKKPYELSELLPWLLAQDLNHHLAANPQERLVLLTDEYERVFDEGGAGARWKENPFDRHLRRLIAETNGLLAAFFSRERLPWEHDPDWRADLDGAQHLLGGLADRDADAFLRAVPIEDEGLRSAMIDGARETAAAGAPVYALMLDLQVEHWAALVAQGTPIAPEQFRVAAADFAGRRRELVERVLRDYGPQLQTTLNRLSFARRFDRPAFEHVVRTFLTGLPLDAFETVAAMSFVTRGEDGYLTLHGVVAEAIREMLDEETRRSSLQALFEHFAARGVVASHREVTAASVAALFEAAHAKRELSAREYLDWLFSAVDPVMQAARYADAATLSREALATSEAHWGPDHPDTARSLNNLAYLLDAQGDHAGARPLYERALAIRETALGPEHPDTARSLNNLAYLLQVQGDHAGARPLYERAIAIRETALGPEHSDTARSLNNLGTLLHELGDLAAAKPLLERALAIKSQALGPEHPDTARCLNNLGALLDAQGDHAGAKPLYERALVIYEQALGPEHPNTALSLNNLGYLLHAQGDHAGARPFYERALAIRETALGPEHPDTAASLNNLAALLRAQGDHAEAKPLYERALAIYETALGPDHPTTNAVRANLESLGS